MSSKEGFLVTLFGATGDLAKRKLFPALYSLYREGHLSPNFAVVGLGRRILTEEQYNQNIKSAIDEFCRYDLEEESWDEFISHFYYFSLNVNHSEDYAKLNDFVLTLEEKHDIPGNRLFYLAISPKLFSEVSYNLKENALLDNQGWNRLVIEKPFGHNHESAVELNNKLAEVFQEEEIFRIDHYLGKEMVQNIEVLRFANSMFEPLWNNKHIDNVQITSSEVVGVGDRGGYYDHSGALRDMIQNHLLQMLALTAMEPPKSLDTEAIRDEKVKVLQAIRPFDTVQAIEENIVRAQYTAGSPSKGYRQEEQVAADSITETYVAAQMFIDNERWDGVPFYLRTGKNLPVKGSEIIIQFKNNTAEHVAQEGNLYPNLLVIRVQPEEGIYIKMNAKDPKALGNVIPITLDFNQTEITDNSPEAYERLINDCIAGDSTYFVRWDEVALAWKIVDPITEAWSDLSVSLHEYEAGTWGPEAAENLVAKRGTKWWPLLGE